MKNCIFRLSKPENPVSKAGPLTMKQSTVAAPALSPLNGKPVMLNFDGAEMSSDAGLTLLREVERRHDLAGLVASCLTDLREPGKVRHSLQDIVRFRIMMIAAGYEDGNDANDLRDDPAFKLALERDPETGAALCSQPTISRMENLADTRALIRMAHEMVRFYCASFARPPRQIVLDIDDTFDVVHGHQQLRLFNAYYDEYGFQPIVVFDGEGRLVGAVLRPARRPTGKEAAAHIRRLIRSDPPPLAQDRDPAARRQPLWHARRSSTCATASGLQLRVRLVEERAPAGVCANPGGSPRQTDMPARGEKLRRFKSFSYAARSWSKARRVIARVEVGPLGRDTRYIVTNLDWVDVASIFTKRSTLPGDRPKTTSRAGRGISPPIARPARRPAPTRCGSCCTAAPTGCGGHYARPVRNARHGGALSSTRCASTWSNWPRPSSRRKQGSS